MATDQAVADDKDQDWQDYKPSSGGDGWSDYAPPKPESGLTPANLAANKARNAQPTQFEKDNAMSPNERQANEFLLGAASGASGLPETTHPITDAFSAVRNAPQPSVGEIVKQGIIHSTIPGYDVIHSLLSAGKNLVAPPSIPGQDPNEQRAHAAGSIVGQVAPMMVGEGVGKINPSESIVAPLVRTPNNTPRLLPRIASKAVLPHWIAGEGLSEEALDKVLPMRTATDTAGRAYTPPNPTERAAMETDAAERQEIIDRTRASEEAKAKDVNATNKLNQKADEARAKDIDATNKLNGLPAGAKIAKNPVAPPTDVPRGTIPGVSVVPEPRALFEGEKPGYNQSTPRRLLLGNANAGRPGAADAMRNAGGTVIYAPKGVGIEPTAERLARLQSIVAAPGELHGNATPFGDRMTLNPVGAPGAREIVPGNEFESLFGPEYQEVGDLAEWETGNREGVRPRRVLVR